VITINPDGSRRVLAVSELKVGHSVLTVNAFREQGFAKVIALPHSSSSEEFVKITMQPATVGASSKYEIMATLHHTFPQYGRNEEAVRAMDLNIGDCLHTITGKGRVASVKQVPIKEGDVTYTIELDSTDLVAVGGIFTHAKMTLSAPPEMTIRDLSRATSLATAAKTKNTKDMARLQTLFGLEQKAMQQKLEHLRGRMDLPRKGKLD
jgi:hypothetical protein